MSLTGGMPARRRLQGAIEALILLAAFAGMGMFAYSIVDIVRIESSPAALLPVAERTMPPYAWPGIILFFGCMAALRIVRFAASRRPGRESGLMREDEAL